MIYYFYTNIIKGRDSYSFNLKEVKLHFYIIKVNISF